MSTIVALIREVNLENQIMHKNHGRKATKKFRKLPSSVISVLKWIKSLRNYRLACSLRPISIHSDIAASQTDSPHQS
jgi:hypothetical protein